MYSNYPQNIVKCYNKIVNISKKLGSLSGIKASGGCFVITAVSGSICLAEDYAVVGGGILREGEKSLLRNGI